ncbi:hypothetical protein [Mycobacterium haemophilum]
MMMVYTGNSLVDPAPAVPGRTNESIESGVSVPGVIAAASWAAGLLVGLFALATGHAVVATVALVLAIVAPWVGLARVQHARRRDNHAKLPDAGGL